MIDPRMSKLAEMLVNYSAAVKSGDKVLLRFESGAEPLMKVVHRKVLEAGGLPYIMAMYPWANEDVLRYGSDEQLNYVPAATMQLIRESDAMIVLMGSNNTRSLTSVNPARRAQRAKAFNEFFQVYLDRAASGDLRWTLSLFPTEAHAQDADMSLEEYEDFVYSACMPDQNDPVGYWQRVSAQQQKIIDWLKGKRQVRVVGPDTDLTLSVADRAFMNSDCHENVPDGEIFTGPVEDSMEGHVAFNYPTIYDGHEVDGVHLWFERGKVVKATASKNEEYLQSVLNTDPGASYVGEFAIGTNEGIQRFTRQILFDEKIGGSFHMALGAGYPETGNTNQSAIHWDMICDLRDGGEIWVDGEKIYQNGKFILDL